MRSVGRHGPRVAISNTGSCALASRRGQNWGRYRDTARPERGSCGHTCPCLSSAPGVLAQLEKHVVGAGARNGPNNKTAQRDSRKAFKSTSHSTKHRVSRKAFKSTSHSTRHRVSTFKEDVQKP